MSLTKRKEEERPDPAELRGWRWRPLDRDVRSFVDGILSWGASWHRVPQLAIEIVRTKRLELGWEIMIDGGGGDSDGHLWIKLPFLFLSFSPENISPEWLKRLVWKRPRHTYARECGTCIGLALDGAMPEVRVRVCVWADPNAWSRDGNRTWPWKSTGWQWSWDMFDTLLGKVQCESKDKETHAATVRLPEGDYTAKVEIQRCRWWRPRWPLKSPLWWRGNVSVEQGVETDGGWKGPVFAMSLPVESDRPHPQTLANRFAVSILKDRYRKRGTWCAEWRPPPTPETDDTPRADHA